MHFAGGDHKDVPRDDALVVDDGASGVALLNTDGGDQSPIRERGRVKERHLRQALREARTLMFVSRGSHTAALITQWSDMDNVPSGTNALGGDDI